MAKLYILTFIFRAAGGAVSLRYKDAKEAREHYMDGVQALKRQAEFGSETDECVWVGAYDDGECVLRMGECTGIMLAEMEQQPDVGRYAAMVDSGNNLQN